MAHAALSLTLPLFDVDDALRRLPASSRAQVSWAQKPIKEGLRQLQTEPATTALVARVAKEMWPAIGTLQSAFMKVLVENHDAWSAKVVDEMRIEEEQLGAFLDNDDARDTLDWVLGFLQSLFTIFMGSAALQKELPDNAIEELGDDEAFLPYVRALVALMGAISVAKADGDVVRGRDLLNISFLEMNRFVATLRAQGVFVAPFPNEGIEDRRLRLRANAERVRRSFSDSDWSVLRDARVRNIR